MIFKNTIFCPQNRRGLSSIVGSLFFTVLMIAGFSVLSLALDAQTDIVTTQRIVSDIEIKKQQEQFGVAVSTDASDILNVSINNQGQNPVEIASIWITNKTLPTQPVKRFTINYDDAFVPSGFTSNVISTQSLEMIPDKYDIKVISTFGSIKTVELDNNGGGSSDLRVELFTDPPDPVIGKNVTVALMVTNTGLIDTISNVKPYNFDFTAPGSVGITPDPLSSPPSTPEFVNLNPGASVMFTWDFQVTGDSGDELTFSSSATGDGVGNGNTASDTSLLRVAGEGGSEEDPDILNEDLLARPKLFLTIPSSQGDADQKALWGVNIVNPVNAPMEVTKLSLTAFSPGANNNDKLFAASCLAESISPAGDNDWNCPSENIIMWQDSSNPVTIPANSTQSFLVKVLPGTIAGQNILESIVVQTSVFTNIGSFGKSGYQTTMYDGAGVIGNVYLSDLTNSRDNADIQSTRVGIVPNSVETFNIVFADMDADDDTFITAGAKLVINVPKEWTDVTILGGTSGFSSPTVTVFGDGSSQIVGTTTANLGTATNVADTIQFSAKAPNNTSDQMYVMYVLAQGQTDQTFSIGPLSEIVLQVDGS
jgi:hypothetical protein